MANLKHLAILKQGVEVWNRWRERHPPIAGPDLTGADLGEVDLRSVNLAGAKLHKASLYRARLSNANLTGADLSEASFGETNLVHANLVRANLGEARFFGATLSGATLREANLRGTTILNSSFGDADFRGANLVRASFIEASLHGVLLEDADLRLGRLIRCDLSQAALTGAKLYGTARDEWRIGGVECRYAFWDIHGLVRTPGDRDLDPGEFEQLYRALPTIEYVLQNGMTPLDPLIMHQVVQAIREHNPEYDIRVESINERGLAPSITLTVEREEQKEPALVEVTRRYKDHVERLEADKDRLYALLVNAIEDNHAKTRLLAGAVQRIGDNIHAEGGATVAARGASINIECIDNAIDLQKIIAQLPEDNPTFATVTKKSALDLIGSALKDVAKGQMKEAAEQIYELGKNLGPVVVNTAAYGFLKSCLGL